MYCLQGTDGHKNPKQLPPINPPFFPRQAGLDGSQAWAALLPLKEIKDRAEVETTPQTGQKVSERGTGKHTGHAE